MRVLYSVMATGFLLAACGEALEGVVPIALAGNGPGGVPLRAVGDDRGIDAAPLADLQAGIWIDPDGCQVWMIDDGLEGYWSRRRDPRTGLPVCVPIAPPGSIVGNIDRDAGIRDSVPTRQ